MGPLAPLAGPLATIGVGMYAANKSKQSKPKVSKIDPIEEAKAIKDAQDKERKRRAGYRTKTLMGGEVGDDPLKGPSLLGASDYA